MSSTAKPFFTRSASLINANGKRNEKDEVLEIPTVRRRRLTTPDGRSNKMDPINKRAIEETPEEHYGSENNKVGLIY